ncbi:uncharacterized protein LOC142238991 [Haematobia irritans]|uniref:uncharacterized protein LOC142238991 n=1 Tax=Haematobia irritans TaxID=7368 RepID=UPI003F50A906
MEYFTYILIIGFLCLQYFNPLEGLEKRNIPWFIYENEMYYIDTNPNYTSKEAAEICREKKMMKKFLLGHTDDILKYVTDTYGFIPSFWTFNNEDYKRYPGVPEPSSPDPCYKLDTRQGSHIEGDCSGKMALLCRRPYVGSTIYFINGTRRDIGKYDVKTYCDPHSVEYDNVIQLCLVRYFTVISKGMRV